MQLIVNIENENIADKVVHFLKSLQQDGVEVQQQIPNNEKKSNFSDSYIEKNWQEVVSKALKNYDSEYEKSFQYKLDRADFQEMKGNM